MESPEHNEGGYLPSRHGAEWGGSERARLKAAAAATQRELLSVVKHEICEETLGVNLQRRLIDAVIGQRNH